MDWILTIVVSVLMANHSLQPVHHYKMTYETRHACEAAEEQLDPKFIGKWYGAKHHARHSIPGSQIVATYCATNDVYDPGAEVDQWHASHYPYVLRAINQN